MNAQNIDWTQAPAGYDYYIVDTAGEYPAEFHYKEHHILLGNIYIDIKGRNWIGGDDRIEIYERPDSEQSAKPVRLRCVTAEEATYFTVGKTYEVLETRAETGSHLIRADTGTTLFISGDTLEFCGAPSIGTFEVVSGDTDESKVAPDEFNDEPYEFDTASDEPEQDQSCVVTHLRCISSDESDDSFSVGTVYEVLNPTEDDGTYMLMGDDDMRWAIHGKTLEFIGSPEIGKFEIAKVGDSVEPSESEPEKTGPVFGDMVHVKGKPYVFLQIDDDDDYVLVDVDNDNYYAQLEEIDEYAPKKLSMREKVLRDLGDYHGAPREDRDDCRINYSVPALLDFITENKDNWQE